jgi:parallel beta-helix repeat protein
LEGWEESFLERNGKQLSPLFANKNIFISKPDLFRPEAANQWYNRFEEERPGETFPELIYFLSLIANAPDKVFMKEIDAILDRDAFLRWSFLTTIFGDFSQLSNGANINFFFNNATGTFEPVLFDATLAKLSDPIDISQNRLMSRILKQKKLMARFEQIARSYLSNPDHLANDLAFYDSMTDSLLPSIYRDNTKIQTSFEARAQIASDRNIYQHNFLTLASMLETGGIRFHFAEESYPLGDPLADDEFSSFRAVSSSRNEFLKNNPLFVAGMEPSVVILPSGSYRLTSDIIIPRNLTVIIREGVKLFLGPSVSLISFSPVTAAGTPAQPILFTRLNAKSPWGVFAVVNTTQKSVFSHVALRGGKDATNNGVYFSGMLSAHNADVEFRHGTIENASADDGIHILFGEAVIADTLFDDNSADSVDIDFARGESLFERNLFTATGGDAIDLSFSKIVLRDNTVKTCGDKGISVGEASHPLIEKNSIKNCIYGIAVKDRSEATMINNILEENKTAIGLYRKKPHFITGGEAILSKNEFIGNQQNISSDEYSRYREE